MRVCLMLLCLVVAGSAVAATDAIDEVNATRAARGLPPFIKDPNLTAGAMAVADYRASNLIAGHTSSDFAFLPRGVFAPSAGCAAWHPGWGWGACCTYDSWRYAGAAYAVGRDGRRYMHLFVHNQPCTAGLEVTQQVAKPVQATQPMQYQPVQQYSRRRWR